MYHQPASKSSVALEHPVKRNLCEDLTLAPEYAQLRSGLQALRKGCEGAAHRLEQVALASNTVGFEPQAGRSQPEELTTARGRAVKELAAARARAGAAAEASMASELATLRTELVQERAECSALAEAAAAAHTRELACQEKLRAKTIYQEVFAGAMRAELIQEHAECSAMAEAAADAHMRELACHEKLQACQEELRVERLLSLQAELEDASSVTRFLRGALDAQVSQREELLVASRENQAACMVEHKAVVECSHRNLSEEAAQADDARQQKMIEETKPAHAPQTVEAALTERGSLAGRAWRQRRHDATPRTTAEDHSMMTPPEEHSVPGCCLEQDLEVQLLPPLPPPLSPPSSSRTCGSSIVCGPLHEEIFALQAAASTAESEVAIARAEFNAASKAETRALFAAHDEAEVAAGLYMELERERARHASTIGAAESAEARLRAEIAAATADAPSPHEELWWAGAELGWVRIGAPQAEPLHHSIGHRSTAASRSRPRPHCAWWPWRWT